VDASFVAVVVIWSTNDFIFPYIRIVRTSITCLKQIFFSRLKTKTDAKT